MDWCLDMVTSAAKLHWDMFLCVRSMCLGSIMCDGFIALRLW